MIDWNQFQVFYSTGLRHIGFRDDGGFKTMFAGFAQTLFTVGYGSDLARQADFTKHKQTIATGRLFP